MGRLHGGNNSKIDGALKVVRAHHLRVFDSVAQLAATRVARKGLGVGVQDDGVGPGADGMNAHLPALGRREPPERPHHGVPPRRLVRAGG